MTLSNLLSHCIRLLGLAHDLMLYAPLSSRSTGSPRKA